MWRFPASEEFDKSRELEEEKECREGKVTVLPLPLSFLRSLPLWHLLFFSPHLYPFFLLLFSVSLSSFSLIHPCFHVSSSCSFSSIPILLPHYPPFFIFFYYFYLFYISLITYIVLSPHCHSLLIFLFPGHLKYSYPLFPFFFSFHSFLIPPFSFFLFIPFLFSLSLLLLLLFLVLFILLPPSLLFSFTSLTVFLLLPPYLHFSLLFYFLSYLPSVLLPLFPLHLLSFLSFVVFPFHSHFLSSRCPTQILTLEWH